jgi:hypothetical protein
VVSLDLFVCFCPAQVKVVHKEQLTGIRKSLVPLRTGVARYDVPRVLKAILVRKDFLMFIKTRFPKMDYLIESYISPDWYSKAFPGISDGMPSESRALEDDGNEGMLPDSISSGEQGDAYLSSYTCHPLLKGLLERLMRNGYESSMCRLAQDSVPGKNLMVASLDESLANEINKIAERYTVDFPPVPQGLDSQKTTVIVDPGSVQPLEVVTKKVLEDDKDYRLTLAEYNAVVAKCLF